ncbi:MAG: DUF1501 domain-containing protein [Verrucomicrobiales bacterium]
MLHRRKFLKLGALGISLPKALWLKSFSNPRPARASIGRPGKAKRCIVLFAWGGISHIDTWDPKPHAAPDVRGEFRPISTSVPGIHIGEHMPLLARKMHQLTVVRSVYHQAPSHRSAAYWNLTGHPPPNLSGNWPATRNDHPCLASKTFAAMESLNDPRLAKSILKSPVALPYTMADGGRANGQDGGFLGIKYDPVVVRPKTGTLYNGVSPQSGSVNLEMPKGMDRERVAGIRDLLDQFEETSHIGELKEAEPFIRSRDQAYEMLLNPAVRDAFNTDLEPQKLRDAYGQHICGQSALMARRLVQAGIPMVTVYCSAGDLNGSVGDHFDTHGDNFNRLKNSMLPPLDQASYALLEDLKQQGMLEDTLVCWLTEFGRTPRINGAAGRDHYPNCYSVAFAGAGVAGGNIYGKSDSMGAEPLEAGCTPEDLHATIFHALGMDPETLLHDLEGRPFPLASGKPLPIFG